MTCCEFVAGARVMASPPLITSDDSYSPRPTSSSSRHLGSRPGSATSMTFNNSRYSPPCALDLTPKQSGVPNTNHILSAAAVAAAYLPSTFGGLMAGTANSAPGLSGHAASFGPSGELHGRGTSTYTRGWVGNGKALRTNTFVGIY